MSGKRVKCAYINCENTFVKIRPHQKYCCAKCKMTQAGIDRYNQFKKPNKCKYCGSQFEGNGSYCSNDCLVIHKNIMDSKRSAKKRRKNEMSPLAKINEMARAEGLSYGKYLAKHGYGTFSTIF